MSDQQKNHHYGFAQVARVITRGRLKKKLTLAEKGLYTCLKDICGDDGECFYPLRNLAEEIGATRSTLSRLIPKLVKAGAITAELKKRDAGYQFEIWHIRIVDLWEENDATYAPAEQKLFQNETKLPQDAPADEKLFQNETKLFQNDVQNKNLNNNQEEESNIVAALADDDAPSLPQEKNKRIKKTELTEEQQGRVHYWQNFINQRRGGSLREKGPRINETTCLQTLVHEYTDEQIEDIYRYCERHWKYKENPHEIGGRQLLNESRPALTRLNKQPSVNGNNTNQEDEQFLRLIQKLEAKQRREREAVAAAKGVAL